MNDYLESCCQGYFDHSPSFTQWQRQVSTNKGGKLRFQCSKDSSYSLLIKLYSIFKWGTLGRTKGVTGPDPCSYTLPSPYRRCGQQKKLIWQWQFSFSSWRHPFYDMKWKQFLPPRLADSVPQNYKNILKGNRRIT